MAQYEHLPIYREAMRLAVHLGNTVRGFSRYPWLNGLFRLDRDTMPRVRRNLMKNTESRYASPM